MGNVQAGLTSSSMCAFTKVRKLEAPLVCDFLSQLSAFFFLREKRKLASLCAACCGVIVSGE